MTVAIAAEPSRANRWRRHPALSRVLRLAVFVVPTTLSFCVALWLSAVLPRVTSAGSAIVWIAVVCTVSLVTLVLLERAARRLLPLAARLDLSLLVPDRAPGRFAIARMSGRQHDLHRSLREAQKAGHIDEAVRMRTVIALVLALSVHDRATRGHSERVRVLTDMLAEEMKVSEEGRARLRWAAMLHDIGKLDVPTTTLNKKGTPNEAEWVALHRHPEEGAHLVASLMPWLAEWGTAVEQHHERYDGTGYPHGLRGDEISLGARIVALADTYEVMTAPRSYKRPMSVSAARHELIRVASTQLDPMVVRAFLNISIGRLWRTVGWGAWAAQFPLVARLTDSLTRLGNPSVAGATAATVLVVGGFTGATSSRAFANASPEWGTPMAMLPGAGADPPSGGTGSGGSLNLQLAGVDDDGATTGAAPRQVSAPGAPSDAPVLATQQAPAGSGGSAPGHKAATTPMTGVTAATATSASANRTSESGQVAGSGIVCSGPHGVGAHIPCSDASTRGQSTGHMVSSAH